MEKKFFKCNKCGQIVETINPTGSKLTCCETEMMEIVERSIEASLEKHIPVIEASENGTRVIVGEIEHPMTEDHFIEWIEVIDGAVVIRKYLQPNEKPILDFDINFNENLKARAYCNLHGLWSSN